MVFVHQSSFSDLKILYLLFLIEFILSEYSPRSIKHESYSVFNYENNKRAPGKQHHGDNLFVIIIFFFKKKCR